MKIENGSRKHSHKLDGISVGDINDSSVYDPVKTTLSESEAEAEESTNHKAWIDWFILPLPTPTIWFLLDHKRRSLNRNWCFASESGGLNYTRSRSDHSAPLITIKTTTPSQVKTSLKPFVQTSLDGMIT